MCPELPTPAEQQINNDFWNTLMMEREIARGIAEGYSVAIMHDEITITPGGPLTAAEVEAIVNRVIQLPQNAIPVK